MTKHVNLFNGASFISDSSRKLIERLGDYEVLHIDENPKMHGFASSKPQDAYCSNTINLINFDRLIYRLQHTIDDVDDFGGNYIHSNLGVLGTWSKTKQHKMLAARSEECEYLTVPEFMSIDATKWFVRNDMTSGSKGIGVIQDLLGSTERIILTPNACKERFPYSCEASGFYLGGELKDLHISHSPTRYKDTYQDTLCWNMREDYKPLNNLYGDLHISDEHIRRVMEVTNHVCKVLELEDGIASLELFHNEDYTEFMYVECDFRICDYTWVNSSAVESYVKWALETQRMDRI